MEEAVDTERSSDGIAPIASEGVAHGSGDVERAGGEVGESMVVVDRGGRCKAVAVVRLLISSEMRCFRILGIYEKVTVDKRSSCLRSHLGNVRWLLCSVVLRKGGV
jgi:hypothetical protein